MLYGGFIIHFYNASELLSESIIYSNISSTLLLIGSIVYVYQLRKRNVYGNYKWIEESKKTYILKKIKHSFIFSMFFSLNILSFIINKVDLILGIVAIGYSLISIIITYMLYALYEKNHFDDLMLLEENKKRGLPKNASMLIFIPLIYSIIFLISNQSYTFITVFQIYTDATTNLYLMLINNALILYSLNISLLTIISFIIIYKYIKQTIPKLQYILGVYKAYIIC